MKEFKTPTLQRNIQKTHDVIPYKDDLTYIFFEKIVPSENKKRFYILYPVQSTLFDGIYAVRTVYGRINERKRVFTKFFLNELEGEKYWRLCFNKRIKHGYNFHKDLLSFPLTKDS